MHTGSLPMSVSRTATMTRDFGRWLISAAWAIMCQCVAPTASFSSLMPYVGAVLRCKPDNLPKRWASRCARFTATWPTCNFQAYRSKAKRASVMCTRFVRAFAGEKLAAGAQAALVKIEAVLPPELRERSSRTRIYAPIWRDEESTAFAARIDQLHASIEGQRVLRLFYKDEVGRESERQVEPLCLAFWGGKWTLGTWCRLRGDFRNFRPDRIGRLEETGEVFDSPSGRNLEAYLQAMRGYYSGLE
jgi:hypothetical protein